MRASADRVHIRGLYRPQRQFFSNLPVPAATAWASILAPGGFDRCRRSFDPRNRSIRPWHPAVPGLISSGSRIRTSGNGRWIHWI